MSEVPQIIDFYKVIEPHLPNAKLVSYTSKYLTKPGENYGSIMLSINATLKDLQGKVSEKSFVAKLPPVTNDLFWQIFQPEHTCITENAVYKYLAPALEKLQYKMDMIEDQIFYGFPRYYGSRISLDPQATKVDRDAVLVQENLQELGYKSGNRLEPYDLEHTLLTLKYMAQYHALPIALRLKQPDTYDKIVRPYFQKYNMGNSFVKPAQEGVLAIIETTSHITEQEVARLAELFKLEEEEEEIDVTDGPYTTIVHSDLWINNIMIKYAVDGRPQQLKFVDFQMCTYESLVNDIIFFLLSSVDTRIVDQRFDELLKFYFAAFVDCLQSVKVDTSIYTYESFLIEIKRVAGLQVSHAMIMTNIIMAEHKRIPDNFKDIDLSVISTGNESVAFKLGEIIRLAKKFEFFY